MLDFLRLLTPRHGNALRPASLLHRLSSPSDAGGTHVGEDAQADVVQHASQWPSSEPTATQAAAEATRDDDARTAPAPQVARTTAANPTTRSRTPARSPIERASAASIAIGATTAQATRPLSPAESPHVASRGRNAAPGDGAPQPSVDAPLSPAAVAMHASASHAAPIIHVNIDRIEVRAPAPPTKAKTSRPRTPPTQSLGDYLRGRKGTPA